MERIWIWNHYASRMFIDKAGRHYWLAEHLKKRGFDPTIFCASTVHNSDEIINTNKLGSTMIDENGIRFVFIDTPIYRGNRSKRLINMYSFYRGLIREYRNIVNEIGKPTYILASSVHPLTLIAGLKIAKKLDIPCICEVRDLWPESLVAYGYLNGNSLLAKLLYFGEKKIYENADLLIMTWPGGKNYIRDRNWEGTVNINKVIHISNGIDRMKFDYNAKKWQYKDADLQNKSYQNFVYTGSIREVNNIGMLLDVAKIIGEKNDNIRLVIFGTGNEREILERRCKAENINNVVFKGKVEKEYIPSILNQAYVNILHNKSTSLDRYGSSQNKLFEYLAAGRCILQTYRTSHSVIEEFNCGVTVAKQSPISIAQEILKLSLDKDLTVQLGHNARVTSERYDFSCLTELLIDGLRDLNKEKK